MMSVASLLCVLVRFAAPAAAEDSPVSASLSTFVYSTYVARGVRQYGGPTDPASQSMVGARADGVGPGALSLTVWNTTALADFDSNGPSALEADLVLSYGASAGPVRWSLAYAVYLYPRAAPVDGAHEIIASATLDATFQPTLTVATEFVRLRGAYVALGLGHRFDLVTDALSLEVGLVLGAAAYDEVALHLRECTLGSVLRWEVTRGFYVSTRVDLALHGAPAHLVGRSELPALSRFTLVGGLGIGASI